MKACWVDDAEGVVFGEEEGGAAAGGDGLDLSLDLDLDLFLGLGFGWHYGLRVGVAICGGRVAMLL